MHATHTQLSPEAPGAVRYQPAAAGNLHFVSQAADLKYVQVFIDVDIALRKCQKPMHTEVPGSFKHCNV
jgi:hypothetical protein